MTNWLNPKFRELATGRTRIELLARLCGAGLFLAAFSVPAAQGQTAAEAWVRRYDSGQTGSEDFASKVVTDMDGNVIVAGHTFDRIAGGKDMLIVKYSGTGLALWTNRYDGPAQADDQASAVAVDNSGNVFVTGSSGGIRSIPDYATIAYTAGGVPLWTNRYNASSNAWDNAKALAVDNKGNVFVTGSSSGDLGSSSDYVTIAYSGAGAPLWTNRYNGPLGNGGDEAAGVAVDNSGNVFVTGSSPGSGSGYDYATVGYSGAGVPLWTNRYNGPSNGRDLANAVAVDNSGSVFVTGSSGGSGGIGSDTEYATIGYSSAGVALWTNRYSGPWNGADQAFAVAVDNSGNVFVTGSSGGSNADTDYATIAYSGAGVPLWTNRYNGPVTLSDIGRAVGVDSSGNVFVTGSSYGNGSQTDYLTIAYSGGGVALWTNRFNGSANSYDNAVAMAVDRGGNIFVTGNSVGSDGYSDYATVAYAGGLPLWTNRYDGPGNFSDYGTAVAVGNSDTVFVTGYSFGIGGSDYATIAYTAAGVALWTNRYNGTGNGNDQASGVAVDNNGNVFITGYSSGIEGGADYTTIAYSSEGLPLWTNHYNGPANDWDHAKALAVDNSGNVFVTGLSYGSGGDSDYATVMYSGAGVALWTNRYEGPANGSDYAVAVAVDNSGNVFITGYSSGIGGFDYATIAYSAGGVPLWTNRYNGPGNGSDEAHGVAVDNSGNVFVTGFSYVSNTDTDYATIAYSGAGVALWTNRYNGPGNISDQANALAVDNSGNVFVTGSSYGSGSSSDYATIAYSGAGVALWTNRYNGPANSGDHATAITAKTGKVFVTGNSTGSRGFSEYATISYSSAGVPLWTNRYDGPVNQEDHLEFRSCLAVGRDGAVYVTGFSDADRGGGVVPDYATVKYVLQPQLTIQPLTGSAVDLVLSASPGSSWSIERALVITGPWTNLGTAQIGTNGLGLFHDSNLPARGAFYRATQP